MQKLKLSVASFFIISFFVLFFGCISVNAEFMPPVVPSEQSLSFLPDFLVSCMQTSLADKGTYLDEPTIKDFLFLTTGQSVKDSMQTKYISFAGKEWADDITVPFWDSNGNQVPSSDVICAFVDSNAGTCCYCYSAITGEILNQGTTFATSKSTALGGEGLTINLATGKPSDNPLSKIIPVYESHLLQSNGVVCPAGTPSDVKLAYENYEFCGYFWANGTNRGVFVPNGCSKDCVILPFDGNYTFELTANAFGSTPQFYCNSYSDVDWYGVIDQPEQNYFARGGVVYGDTFNYTGHYTYGFNELYAGGTVMWKAPTQQQYDRMKNYEPSYSVPSTVNNYNRYVSYDKLIESNPTYITNKNENFDYSQKITNNNYPINYTITYPDYSPINNNYYNEITNIYNTMNNPSINDEEQIPEITDPNQYPLLSNLEKRFPFSIPFDIKNMISLLSAPRETPYIDEDIEIPNLVSGQPIIWHFEYDLHEFDDTAGLFRKLFLILYVITLAYWCYDHFFGS